MLYEKIHKANIIKLNTGIVGYSIRCNKGGKISTLLTP